MSHKFECEICGRLCGKGEFGYLSIMSPHKYESDRTYFCHEHLQQVSKVPVDQQWEFCREAEHKYFHEERGLLSYEKPEDAPICAHCGAAVLGTNQYAVYGRDGLEHRLLCEKCFEI